MSINVQIKLRKQKTFQNVFIYVPGMCESRDILDNEMIYS